MGENNLPETLGQPSARHPDVLRKRERKDLFYVEP